MTRRTKGFRVAAATAACIASLGFAACGGDDDDEGDTSSETTEETGATGAEGSGASFDEALRSELEAGGNSPAVIDCIFEKGEDLEATDEEIAEAQETGQLPDSLAQTLAELATECQAEEG